MLLIELIKAAVLGVVQGITEWLPISSTGHLVLVNEVLKLDVSADFKSMFEVVIQLGSILAVLVLYFSRLNPWSKKKSPAENKYTLGMWGKIVIAAVPGALIGFLIDDAMDSLFKSSPKIEDIVIAAALIVYGIAFIVIERLHKNKKPRIDAAENIDWKTALGIGVFQVLALVPGTSRSGSTIVGAILLGVSRTAAAEFSFFLAIPMMLGASGLRGLKYVMHIVSGEAAMFTVNELGALIVGTVVSFLVSLVVVKFLVSFVRRHSFESFGWYRIALGIAVFIYVAVVM